jgi:glycerol-3-phosphate dehydrogenase
MKNHLAPSPVFDVAIIGGGVVGCAIARELSRFDLRIALFEQESDVATGASGRNSGVVHAGFNNPPGSLKARLCVEGNALFETACRELNVPFRRTGKLVVALNESDLPGLEKLQHVGETNRVPGLQIIDQAAMQHLEPNITGIAALWSPATAITSPFQFTVALAENAHRNGVRFFLETGITRIRRNPDGFHLFSGTRKFAARTIVNAAGLFADRVARLGGITKYRIYPCRGQYHVLDRETSTWLTRPVYPVPRPESGGLGVHLTPTIEGNLLIGPSAEYIEQKHDFSTTHAVMDQLTHEARELLPLYSPQFIIRSYSGIRAKLTSPDRGGSGDFIIDSESVPQMVNLIGIESPGLTSALPLAHEVMARLRSSLPFRPNPDFSPEGLAIPRFQDLSPTERAERVAADPDFGDIICRCEMVSRAEVLAALRNPLGVKTLTGLKYRSRVMTGRCQGGYCLPRLVKILRQEGALSPKEITLRGGASRLFFEPIQSTPKT